MGHQNDGADIFAQMIFQPGDRFRIQMVGWFVKQEDFRFGQQQATQCHATAFTPGEDGYVRILRRTTKRFHGKLHTAVQIPGVGGIDLFLQLALFGDQFIHFIVVHWLGEFQTNGVKFIDNRLQATKTIHDIFKDILFRIQMRLLFQVTDPHPFGGPGFSLEVLVLSGDNPHQRRFTGAVDADDGNLCIRHKGQGNILKGRLRTRVGLVQTLHHITILIRRHVLLFTSIYKLIIWSLITCSAQIVQRGYTKQKNLWTICLF